MEKEQFLSTEPDAWWLVTRDVEYRIEAGRRALGETLGWGDPLWYKEPVNSRAGGSGFERCTLACCGPRRGQAEAVRHPFNHAAGRCVYLSFGPVRQPGRRHQPRLFPTKQAPASKPSVRAAPAADENTVELHAAVQEVLTELSGDRGAALAGDLGLTAEEASDLAHDPDFERMVAEEGAKLTPQRSE